MLAVATDATGPCEVGGTVNVRLTASGVGGPFTFTASPEADCGTATAVGTTLNEIDWIGVKTGVECTFAVSAPDVKGPTNVVLNFNAIDAPLRGTACRQGDDIVAHGFGGVAQYFVSLNGGLSYNTTKERRTFADVPAGTNVIDFVDRNKCKVSVTVGETCSDGSALTDQDTCYNGECLGCPEPRPCSCPTDISFVLQDGTQVCAATDRKSVV